MYSEQYIRVKIIVIGDAGVGKTSLVRQYVNETSPGSNNNDKTRGPRVCDITEMTFMWEHDVIKFSILDTAGLERYRSITSSHYRGTNGCLIVFDVSNKSSFDHVKTWYNDLDRYSLNPDALTIILVGTKKEPIKRAVSKEMADALARHLGIPYLEVDTTGDSVTDVFDCLLRQTLKRVKTYPELVLSLTTSTKPDTTCQRSQCSC